jgi:hypothetical protein
LQQGFVQPEAHFEVHSELHFFSQQPPVLPAVWQEHRNAAAAASKALAIMDFIFVFILCFC